ncbi:MAG: GGDEF domain-containing protein [Desulfobacterales bacterium]|jgi:two-component system cell cycle response regulator
MKESQHIDLSKTVTFDDEPTVLSEEPHPYLVIYIGNSSGRRHKLNGGFVTIGRSPEADIRIEDDRISRIHCVIERNGQTITIEDKGSTNGTYVDARKISRTSLLPGVPLQLGRSIMKIEYKTEAEIRSEKKLLQKASLDALTGIFNRHHFTKLASMEMAYAGRHKLPVGVVLMDIDNFKQVNDTYGHQSGDFVLAQLANTVIENKRTEDLFGRYGGDEFVILPRGEISKEGIQVHCERIRKAIEGFEFHMEDICVRITISLGFHLMKAESSDSETMLSDLIHKADQALYLAKERGRNRTESLFKN